MLRAATTSELFGTVCALLAVPDFHVGGTQRRELRDEIVAATELSQQVGNAAFDLEVDEALSDAHRTLYALYGDRIWRAPMQPRPLYAQSALDEIRGLLEQRFRAYLARRRDRDAVRPPEGGSAELESWFTELATGPHPHEDPDWPRFIRETISLDQLREIVAQRALFFLREPDPWIYAVPALTGVAKAGLIDLLLDEYGWGKLERMHSSVYARLMAALGLESELDHYEATASWQYLATLNHQWMLASTPGMSRRLLGTIYLTEADSPSAMTNYLAAWERLGIDDPEVLEFYELHVAADENHREVALQEVVLPSCGQDREAAAAIAVGVFDARTVEAEFAAAMAERFAV